ncbi:MAG TPA: adenylate synthase [Saprospiraceae bacterium]|nr:adenylate synthase [Saprospiraceae bacterium]
MRFKLKIIYYWFRMLLAKNIKSRAELQYYQVKRLQLFGKRTLQKSPYYKRYLKNGVLDLSNMPQISKNQFMENFDAINTKGIVKKEAFRVALDAEHIRNFKSEIKGITVGLSTGTSGKRGLFLVSENERAQWVALVMTRVIKPKIFKKQKIAFFLRANSNLYASIDSNLFAFRYFDIFRPIDQLLSELDLYKPDILAAQPSLLIDIAHAQKNGKIHIQPTQILSFAEVLTENDKIVVQNIFNVKITEVYQCMEGFLGVTCDHGTMHLNEDYIYFDKEWIDEYKFYPIITDFSRSTQPVVNYKMNDILVLKKEACSCGSQLLAIEKILGREDDVLLINDKKIYPDLIARRLALHTDDFQKYTIEQINKETLRIGIECENSKFGELQSVFENVLNNLFLDFGVNHVRYVFENKIAHFPGSKLRKIKRIDHEN